MGTEKITVEVTIGSGQKKTWRLWTQPNHITQWNFANADWHCPKAENDLKVGGRMCYRMEAKDGSFGFDFECVYTEIIDQQKITYRLPDGRVSTTTLENHGNHTKLITTFDAEQNNPIDIQKNGWQAIINNFKSYVEANC